MKVKAITQPKTILYPTAAVVIAGTVLSGCQQQPQGPPGAPLPPPETEMRADADIQLIPNIEIREPMDKGSQPLPGRKAVP